MKISRVQRATLAQLSEEDGVSAAHLGATVGTLNGLALRGLVKASRDSAAAGAARDVICWAITDAGRAVLAETTDGTAATYVAFVTR